MTFFFYSQLEIRCSNAVVPKMGGITPGRVAMGRSREGGGEGKWNIGSLPMQIWVKKKLLFGDRCVASEARVGGRGVGGEADKLK